MCRLSAAARLRMTPHLIPSGDWPRHADRLASQIARIAAGSGGRWHAEDIEAAIREGHFRVWTAEDGADVGCVMLTETIEYPRLRALRCVALVGHRPRRWIHLLRWVEDVAREQFRCDRIEALYPRTLGRLLPGFHEFHVLSERAL